MLKSQVDGGQLVVRAVLREPFLGDDALSGAVLERQGPPDDGKLWVVALLTPDGSERFREATAMRSGQRIAVVVDGVLVTVFAIHMMVTSDRISLMDVTSEPRAREIAHALRWGPFASKVVVNQRTFECASP